MRILQPNYEKKSVGKGCAKITLQNGAPIQRAIWNGALE